MTRIAAALALIATSLTFATGAPAATPGQVNYQGLLLGAQGQRVNGTVDLVFSIYDAATNGTLLWTEPHPATSVLDGVYDVVLGATTPITPAVVAGGSLYLQITVGGETLTPRQRLVAVPYALRAADADRLGGLDAAYLSQLIHYVDFDGGLPANDDPSEGVADVDGDGRANFVDNDNDNDGVSDGTEIAQQTDINLVTPRITSIQPTTAASSLTTQVTVNGANFEPGMTVSFGSQNPTPQSVTATSFQLAIGPQPPGTVPVQVTRANGQHANTTYQFVFVQLDITSFEPDFLLANTGGVVKIRGTGFQSGVAVAFGSQNPTPQNITATSIDVTVAPEPAGTVDVTVSYPGGSSDTAPFSFVDTSGSKRVFVTSTSYTGNLGGILGANAKCAARATAASLPGSYFAWLGDATGDPAANFNKSLQPYRLVDGTTQVAASYTSLTDGLLDHAIDRDEFNNPVFDYAWTNVTAGGTAGASSCQSWGSASGSQNGFVGLAGEVDADWTAAGTLPCNQTRRLYCIQQ